MNLDALLAHRIATQTVRYSARDTMLYALSVGAGSRAGDERELDLVYEERLRALPTLATVLAHPGQWIAAPAIGANVARLVHGEQRLELLRALPAEGEVVVDHEVRAVVDKGAGRGAIVHFEKRIAESATGRPLAVTSQALYLRDDGGCGSHGEPPAPLPEASSGAPGFADEIRTMPTAALLYRLNGDRNPLHVDPERARRAGFDRPILHGLCTYGIAAYLLVRSLCGYEPARLVSLAARFTSPVFPGETVRIEGHRDGEWVSFRALVPERDQFVLSHGAARIAPTGACT